MTRRAFRIGGWVTLVLGALASTGRVTYPVDIGLGPFSLHDQVSMPVPYGAPAGERTS